jgi:hypothetical protein
MQHEILYISWLDDANLKFKQNIFCSNINNDFLINEFYSHKPNTYSYREVNNNIKHIKFFTYVEKIYNYINQEVGLSY